MSTYKKNIAALIIIACIISTIVGVLLPKSKNLASISTIKHDEDKHINISPFTAHTPFKGEKIFVIKIEGLISDATNTHFIREYTSSTNALELIKKATKDKSIKGIVIRINSPGGTVAASQELYQAVLKARKKKPVVISMGDVAASGGYYIASAADAIFANPGTITGSIGVIASYLNFYELLNKIGVKGIVIKSGEYKDIGNPTRPLSETERKILQGLLDDTYEQFIKDVAKGRNVSKEKIASIAKGLIYTGAQAKKIGLVDFIGDYASTLKYTQKLAKEKFPELGKKYGKTDLPIEETWKTISIVDLILGATTSTPNLNTLENKLLKPVSFSKFQPLWLLE